MIILVTGQPGGGKTLHAVDMLAHDEQFKGRPLFVMGVPDLTIEHTVCPPVEQWTELRQSPEDASIELPYFTFPEGAVVLIDEAQRVYRPRPVGSAVPRHVAAFETHRHTGVDFILITQHAGLVDSNIRKLVGRHIHIRVTALARYKYEWTELGDPESTSSRELAARSKYVLPKRAFNLYKSSQLHTKIKPKIPMYVYIFGVGAIGTVLAIGYVYSRISGKTDEATVAIQSSSPDLPKVSGAVPGRTSDKLTMHEYHEQSMPRIAGLHHTAAKYDDITKPIDAPFPVGCWTVGDKCKCADQQGHRYVTTDAICKGIVQNGIFKDWGKAKSPRDGIPAQPETSAKGARPPPATPSPV